MDDWETLVYRLEDGYLSICGQDLERLPSFKNKRDRNNNLITSVVTTLDASSNRLKTLEYLGEYSSLKVLILDHNNLDLPAFQNFPNLPSLTTLWLNNNNVSLFSKEIPLSSHTDFVFLWSSS
jgi:hypothetical protein